MSHSKQVFAEAASLKTARQTYYESQTLVGLIKGLVGEVTTIDLINESSVYGKIEQVDFTMNLTLSSVIFTDIYDDEIEMDAFFVRGRMIRYVHIPKSISITKTIQTVLHNIRKPMLSVAAQEGLFMRQHKPSNGSCTNIGRGRGRGRGTKQFSDLLSKHRVAGKERGMEYMEKIRQERLANNAKSVDSTNTGNRPIHSLMDLNLNPETFISKQRFLHDKENNSSSYDTANDNTSQNDSDTDINKPRPKLGLFRSQDTPSVLKCLSDTNVCDSPKSEGVNSDSLNMCETNDQSNQEGIVRSKKEKSKHKKSSLKHGSDQSENRGSTKKDSGSREREKKRSKSRESQSSKHKSRDSKDKSKKKHSQKRDDSSEDRSRDKHSSRSGKVSKKHSKISGDLGSTKSRDGVNTTEGH